MSHQPVLVIVAGPPASGKTTLARRLAADLRLPVVHRDQLKRQLYDALEPQQRIPTARLTVASTHLLYLFAEAVLHAGQSAIIEAGFLPHLATHELRALQQRVAFLPFQIQCLPRRLPQSYSTSSRAGRGNCAIHPVRTPALSLAGEQR